MVFLKLFSGLGLFFFSLFYQSAFANFPEFFSTDPKNASLAGQFTGNHEDPANNYYAPALIAFSEKLNFQAAMFFVDTNFHPIQNVTLRNGVNHPRELVGDIDTNYRNTFMGSFHLSFPLPKIDFFHLGVSAIVPVKYFQEVNSGDAFRTEYVMYRSRYNRPYLAMNGAFKIGSYLALSIGAFQGLQISADSFTTTGINGASTQTSGRLKTRAKQTLGLQGSLVFKAPKSEKRNISFTGFLAYQQEMKSQTKAHMEGITVGLEMPFEIELTSMSYYDPHIVRFGLMGQFDLLRIFLSADYQIWSGYETPIIVVEQLGGIVTSSANYERVKTRDIWVPAVGAAFDVTPSLTLRAGASFRPTPLEGDFSGSGNSIDADKTIFAGGLGYRFKLLGLISEINTSIQYHVLDEFDVIKTTGKENGDVGNKVGSPGYEVGGDIIVAGLGLKFEI